MRIEARTIEDLFLSATALGHDLIPVDRAIREAVPALDRWLFCGPSITMVGYGTLPQGDTAGDATWPLIGLAPQKHQISVYVAGSVQGQGIAEHYQGKMGKTSNGVGCIRFRRFVDVDPDAFSRAMLDAASWLASHPAR